MNKEELENLLNEGKSTYEIAAMIGHKSNSTVRMLMKRYGLKSKAKAGQKTTRNSSVDVDGKLQCVRCRESFTADNFIKRKDRDNTYHSYCKACMNKDVSGRYVNLKSKLIKIMGDKCSRCDKSYSLSVYSFHHTEPEHKDFNLGDKRYNSVESVMKELDKCILVCQNCHAEIHHEKNLEEGLSSKNSENTKRWNLQKKYKLYYIADDEPSCKCCGYDTYYGALNIVFPENKKHYRKYNKNFENWDDDFKSALEESFILCSNCNRVEQLSETTLNNMRLE